MLLWHIWRIESDNSQNYHNLTEKNSEYEYSKFISIEEKNIILDMINKFTNKLEKINKKY